MRVAPLKEQTIEYHCLYFLMIQKRQFVFKINQTGFYDTARRCFRKQASPFSMKGVGDAAWIYKGVYHALEFKSEKGRQSVEQLSFQRQLEHAGGKYFIIRNLQEMMKIYEEVNSSKV